MDTATFDLSAVRAVTFDAGGTLLTPHPSVGEVYAEVLLENQIVRNPLELESAFRSAFSSVSKNPAVLDPEEREKDFWRQVVRETLKNKPLPPSQFDEVFVKMWEAFSHANRWRVFDGSLEVLRNLRDLGYWIGVLSNWDHRLHTVLEEAGFSDLVESVVISVDVGVEKPDSGIFRAVEAKSGMPPDASLHVGDSRHHDLTGAQEAGWFGILLRNDGGVIKPPTIGRLADLNEILPGPPSPT
jgi:putative hydrolase of the HAD superfamily